MAMGKRDPRCAATGNLGMGIETPSLRESVNIQRPRKSLIRGCEKFLPAIT